MNPSTHQFVDYSTMPSFPAARTNQRHRWPAWSVGILVAFGVTVGGALLGSVLGPLALGLSPLYPLNLVLGLLVGGTIGLVVGLLLGVVTAVVVGTGRVSRRDLGVPR